MTKNEYIDFIRNSLQMEDKTNKFHPKQVEVAINLAVNTVFYEMYDKNPKVMMKALSRYTSIINDTPVHDADGQYADTYLYRSDLTADVVDLPRKASGIIEIIVDDENPSVTEFVPISTIEGNQLRGSESSLPNNVIGFSYVGPRYIEYWGMTAADAVNGVIIRFIKQFKGYSATDHVILPYGQDERIIELVRQYLGVIPPKDLINDNADANG